MSYCVNCGVELDKAATACPLCHTPVLNPNSPPDNTEMPFFPTAPTRVEPVSKQSLALVISVMLASVGVCCALLNLILGDGLTWSLYIIGAVATLWLWFVPPLLARKLFLWVRGLLDIGAVGVYMGLIAYDLQGGGWFLHITLPLLGAAVLLWSMLCATGAGRKRSPISTVVLVIGGLSCYLLVAECIVDNYLFGSWQAGWSLITLTIGVALILPLMVVRYVPNLRAEAQRRFHL